MADFKTKQGDTRNALKATLKQDGQVVKLTDCSVAFVMQKSGEVVINRDVIINDPTSGVVWVVFDHKELDSIGLHKAEFVVTFPGGKEERFPNDGYLSIEVIKNLEGA